MTKEHKTVSQTTVVIPEQDRLAKLEGFLEVVSERFGYDAAARIKRKDMNEKTAKEAKKAREISSAIAENLEKLVATPEAAIAKTIITKREELKSARKVLKDARKPFIEKIQPLAKAVKYCDKWAIPDSLKELGKPLVPHFSLSEWVAKGLAQVEKEKKAKE